MVIPTYGPTVGVPGWVSENWAELGVAGAVPGCSHGEMVTEQLLGAEGESWGHLQEVVVVAVMGQRWGQRWCHRKSGNKTSSHRCSVNRQHSLLQCWMHGG